MGNLHPIFYYELKPEKRILVSIYSYCFEVVYDIYIFLLNVSY